MRDADDKLNEINDDDLNLSDPKCKTCKALWAQLEKTSAELIETMNELDNGPKAEIDREKKEKAELNLQLFEWKAIAKDLAVRLERVQDERDKVVEELEKLKGTQNEQIT